MTDYYTATALTLGRPGHPCACDVCACPLHAYVEGEECVWCEHGDHEDGDEA